MDGTATNLFEMNREHYLVVVDYFSRYPEVIKLQSLQLSSFIFSWHGIPEVVRSDNGLQYASQEFATFKESSCFWYTNWHLSMGTPQDHGWLYQPPHKVEHIVLCWLIKNMTIEEQSTTNLKCAVRTQGSHTFIRSTESTPTPGMWQETVVDAWAPLSIPYPFMLVQT